MPELPTTDELLQVRSDLQSKLDELDSLTLDDWMNRALAQVKRELKNIRGIKWAMVYDSDSGDYFKDEDEHANNKDQIQEMIKLLTVSLIYKDYSVDFGDDEGTWFQVSQHYLEEYRTLMTEAKIEIDWDESGSITDDEEEQGAVTRFMTK